MIDADLESYGGAKQNAQPVEDASSEVDATTEWNKVVNDLAQLTHTAPRAILTFPTVAAGNSTPASTKTFWGNASSEFPTTVTRTGTGAYQITYPASFDDYLENAETVSFYAAHGHVASGTVFGLVQCTVSGAVVNVYTLDATFALTDLTAGTNIVVWIY
jgi:hypothetical protein